MINKVAFLEFGTNADPIHCLKGKARELRTQGEHHWALWTQVRELQCPVPFSYFPMQITIVIY